MLWDLGTAGVTIEITGAVARLLAYFPARAGLEEAIRAALSPWPGAAVEPSAIPDVDWVARFRENFTAFEAPPFRVVPEWSDEAPGARTLVVSPGRAFGTGTHETTRLCLAALARLAAAGPLGHVLDVGAGTGLLALGALRLGAASAVATDNDPECREACRLHATLNRLPLHVVQADGARPFHSGHFDLVLANLMAPWLLERREELCARVRPGGVLVLSGLLAGDVDEVSAAYAGHGALEVHRDNEWAAIVVRT
ncbi:MAG: 50S ribosomal protein L11 methyltransferase [Vicinamibacteria bacterium]|nr:50S ribosomal protein L11 methyltransferase [Vicinamibacteria bacterium]